MGTFEKDAVVLVNGTVAIGGPFEAALAISEYDVDAAPAPALHDSGTVLPLTVGAFSVGAAGATAPVTVSDTSLLGALVPAPLVAVSRKK